MGLGNGAQHRAGFISGLIRFRLGNRVEHNAGSGLDGSNTFLHVGGTDDDAGVEVAVGGEIAHRAAVAAAAFTFGGGNQLHGADLRRAAEGAKMKADVENRLRFLEECVGRVETLSAGRVENYTNRLYEKLKVILEDRNIDDARVLTEAAIFGDKTAVDEETVRLRSHIAQYRSILELDEPVGRKLDFLTQELNRETNTIGSKCQDLDITRIVVDMKAEIEKIREQIQNLE
jgi:uncharacterized protein (TIGR00255 family)